MGDAAESQTAINVIVFGSGHSIGRAQRCGHGIGLDQCEHPSLNATNSQLLEPGMTFCIEPNYQSQSSDYFVGEEVVVSTN
jgi:Xaa-Pro aminopeptidase